MDAQQKRLIGALALMVAAMVVYDIPAMLPCDRVVSNTVEGNFQTVVMDLTKFDPWAMHAWVRELCYAMLCGSATLLGWPIIAARVIGLAGSSWYIGQAYDAYRAGNLFDDGVWEYSLLGGIVAICSLFTYRHGAKTRTTE